MRRGFLRSIRHGAALVGVGVVWFWGVGEGRRCSFVRLSHVGVWDKITNGQAADVCCGDARLGASCLRRRCLRRGCLTERPGLPCLLPHVGMRRGNLTHSETHEDTRTEGAEARKTSA